MSNFVSLKAKVVLNYKEDRYHQNTPRGLSDCIVYRPDAENFFKNFTEGTFEPNLLELKVAKGLNPKGGSVFWTYPNSQKGGIYMLFIGDTVLYHVPEKSLKTLRQRIFDPKCGCVDVMLDERFKLGIYLDDAQGLDIISLIDEEASEAARIVATFPAAQPSWQEIRDIVGKKYLSESKRQFYAPATA